MAKKLKKMILNRVDLVPAGACQDAHIVLFKTKEALHKDEYGMDGTDDLPLTTNQLLQRNRLWQQWGPLWEAFTSSVWAIMGCGESAEAHVELLMTSIDEFATSAKDILAGLGLAQKAAPLFEVCKEFGEAHVVKAGRVMAGARMQRLKEAILTLQAMLNEAVASSDKETVTTKGARVAEKIAEGAELAAVTKRAEIAEARVHELEAAVAKHSLTPEQEEEAFLKSMPESFRKKWEADRELTKEALATATIEKEKRERQEYIEKTAAYRQVGITPDHHNILKAIDAMPEQERTELLRILKSASAVISQSRLFVSQGSDGSGGGATAGERAMAKAQVLVAEKGAATIQEALDAVLKAEPALYQDYQDEQRQQSRIK